MKRDDIEKLLGGYAAGTLTAEEREALFTAALEDQQLFESLAYEEPLRELLQDSAAKAQLLAALEEVREPWYRRAWRPALISAAVIAPVLIGVILDRWPSPPKPITIAQAIRPSQQEPQAPVRQFEMPRVARPVPTHAVPLPVPPVLTPAPVAAPQVFNAPAAPPAPPARASDSLAEQAKVNGAPEAVAVAALEQDSLKSVRRVVPRERLVRTFAANSLVAGAPQMGLRYSLLQKSADGSLAEVDPRIELDRDAQVVIRLESAQAGYFSVFDRDPQNEWRLIDRDRLLPGVFRTVPKTGTIRTEAAGPKELLLVFSRQPQTAAKPALAARGGGGGGGQVGGVAAGTVITTTSAEPIPQEISLPITLKYK